MSRRYSCRNSLCKRLSVALKRPIVKLEYLVPSIASSLYFFASRAFSSPFPFHRDEQFTDASRAALAYSRSEKFRSPRSSGFAGSRSLAASLLAAQTSPANRYANVPYTPQCGHVGHVESYVDCPQRRRRRGRIRICINSSGISRRRTEKNAKSSRQR